MGSVVEEHLLLEGHGVFAERARRFVAGPASSRQHGLRTVAYPVAEVDDEP